MNPYSPISWLYVYGFLGQNSKNWILRLFLDFWKTGSLCNVTFTPDYKDLQVELE